MGDLAASSVNSVRSMKKHSESVAKLNRQPQWHGNSFYSLILLGSSVIERTEFTLDSRCSSGSSLKPTLNSIVYLSGLLRCWKLGTGASALY